MTPSSDSKSQKFLVSLKVRNLLKRNKAHTKAKGNYSTEGRQQGREGRRKKHKWKTKQKA